MGYFSRALPITATDTINMLPAWEFMNQTGTLGTNLEGSLIQVGTAGNVNVIPHGKKGLFSTVTTLTLLSGGSGYDAGTAVATTFSSIVPVSIGNKPAAGLTVTVTVDLPTATLSAAGTGYSAGAIDSVTGGTGTGIEGTVAINAGVVTAFTFTNGGIGYTVGDVITLVQAASNDNATITLTSAPNGAITTIAVNAAGSNYSPGDIITVIQAGASGGTRAILNVQDLAPVAGDAVLFKAVQAGSILPVSVDYVLVTSTTATDIIAGK